MLPGTLATPSMYTLVVKEAARRGYHAIGLAYDDRVAVLFACEHATSATCFGDVRMKMITGRNTTTRVKVSPHDSIIYRLHALLRYLASTYPREGWGQFLTADDNIDWRKLHVGGHSQGSGDVGLMTKLYPLGRACYFSFGYDRNGTIRLPAWLDMPNVTPASRVYAFINVHDQIVKIDYAEAAWRKLGLFAFGEPFDVDGKRPPYPPTHIFTTAHRVAPTWPKDKKYPQGWPWPDHSEPILDVGTPLNADGSPLHALVWDQVCFP